MCWQRKTAHLIGQTNEGRLLNKMRPKLSKPLRKLCKCELPMVTEGFGQGLDWMVILASTTSGYIA